MPNQDNLTKLKKITVYNKDGEWIEEHEYSDGEKCTYSASPDLVKTLESAWNNTHTGVVTNIENITSFECQIIYKFTENR